MKLILSILPLLSPFAFAQSLLLQGSSDQSFPDIPYNPAKPPTATTLLGTAFPEPPTGGSITRTFRVVNLDGTPGSKLTYSATSSNPAFTITGLDFTLGATSLDEFQITYTPSGESAESGTITFTSNDPSRSSYPFHVSGAAGTYSAHFENQAGDVLTRNVPGANTPLLFTDTTYGPVPRGSASVSKTYKLVNTGSLPVTFLEVTLSGNNAFRSPTLGVGNRKENVIVPAGSVYSVEVVMDTDEILDDARASLTAASFDTVPATFGLDVAGFVTGAPGITIERLAGSWVSAGDSANFGQVEVGFTTTQTYRVRNTGETALTISEVSQTQPSAGFQISGLLPGTLDPGASDVFSVSFTPPVQGELRSFLEITSNAVDGPLTSYRLDGTGLIAGPDLVIETHIGIIGSGFPVPFGALPELHEVAVGESVDEVIRITNNGSAAASLDGYTLSEGFSMVGPLPDFVGPGQIVYFTIRFAPLRAGFHDLILEIQSDSLPEPLVASRPNRGLGIASSGEVALTVVSVNQTTVELLIAPTSQAMDSSFRILASEALTSWESVTGPLTLSTTDNTPVSLPRIEDRMFYRVERIDPIAE